MIRLLAILLLYSPSLLAFEPAAPPPKKTMAWTTQSLSKAAMPVIDFQDTTVEDALVFLSRLEVPKEYKVALDCSKLGELAQIKMTFKAKGISLIEAIGLVAEAARVDILITPGRVSLIPKK